MSDPIFLFGAGIYALAFWLIGWRFPMVPLMLIFATAPFQNDLSGGGSLRFSLAEINLLLSMPIFLLQHKRLSLGPLGLPTILFLLVSLGASIATWRGSDALVSLVQMVLFMVIVVLVFASLARRPEEYRPAMIGLVVIGVFLALAILALRSNYIFGLHKNGVGSSLSCALLVAVELWLAARGTREKVLLGSAAMVILAGLVITVSRGSWICALMGMAVILGLRRQFALMLRAGVLMAIVMAIFWNQLPAEQRDYATSVDPKRWNIMQRYKNDNYAQRLFEQSPIYGMGVGLRKQYDATNVVRLTLAETGVIGLVTLSLVFGTLVSMVWGAQKKLARDDPAFSLLAIGAAVMLGRLTHGFVDHYWGRGGTMIAWASAGMALHAYFLAHQGMARAATPPGTAAGKSLTPAPALALHDPQRRRHALALVSLIEESRRTNEKST